MPTYTVKKADSDSDHTWDVMCSYSELQEMCEEYGLVQVLQPPNFISQHGSTLSRAGSEWGNFLSKVDKKAGRRSKMKT